MVGRGRRRRMWIPIVMVRVVGRGRRRRMWIPIVMMRGRRVRSRCIRGRCRLRRMWFRIVVVTGGGTRASSPDVDPHRDDAGPSEEMHSGLCGSLVMMRGRRVRSRCIRGRCRLRRMWFRIVVVKWWDAGVVAGCGSAS